MTLFWINAVKQAIHFLASVSHLLNFNVSKKYVVEL